MTEHNMPLLYVKSKVGFKLFVLGRCCQAVRPRLNRSILAVLAHIQ
jgi:hypothetical protein